MRAQRENGDFDAAITDYTEAIRLNPEDPDAYYNRGVAHSQLGNKSQAAADHQKARELGYKP
jgi:Flp pilus assembly protein TadD